MPRLRTLFGAWLVLFLIAGAWAIATPISAAPDEPAHIIKAASVARGQFLGEQSANGSIVQVPRYIAHTHAMACFVFEKDTTADCATTPAGDSGALVDATTTAGLYNPIYYAFVGAPSLVFDDDSGVYAMRLASALLCSLLGAFAVTLVDGWRRRTLPLLSLVVAFTPMVFFLNGTVNPNAVEISGTLAVFAAALTLVREPHVRPAFPAFVLAFAGILAANARGLSLLWLAVAVGVPLLLAGRSRLVELGRTRSVQISVAVLAVAAVFAAIWVFSSNSLGSGFEEPDTPPLYPYVGASPVLGFLLMLELTLGYAQGIVGVFGWLDTPAPPVAYFVWSTLVGGMLLWAFSVLRGARLRVVTTLALATVILPALVQAVYITNGGLIWQGRYTLPLFVCLVLGLGAALDTKFDPAPAYVRNRASLIVVLVCGLVQFYSFAIALRRYAVGYTQGWSDMLQAPEWMPPGGIILWITVVLLSALLGSALFVRLVWKHPSQAQPELSPVL